MSGTLTCPRCPGTVRAADDDGEIWTCTTHGPVHPLYAALMPGPDVVRLVAERSGVPMWLPWPVPGGWLVSGVRWAGDDRTGPVACVLALSGPNPFPEELETSRTADILLVAEQPGVGLGARLAGLDDIDPGQALSRAMLEEPPHLKLPADGHDVPLWSLPVEDGAVYAGEAAGVWLWVLTWPATAAAVLMETFDLVDLRDPEFNGLDIPYGALTPRIE